MTLRTTALIAIPSWLACVFVFLLAWPGVMSLAIAAEQEREIGVWTCIQRINGSCPPNGIGRGAEDFWTYPFGVGKKLSVSCKLTHSHIEGCIGIYDRMGIIVQERNYGARLTCPPLYVARGGQCVEVDSPRGDDCQQPAGSPVNAATGGNRHAVTDAQVAGGPGRNAQAMAGPDSRPLELTRHYSSQHPGLTGSIQSRLGIGWRTGFDAEASWTGELSTAKLIHVVLPDFSDHSFALIDGAWKQVLPRVRSTTVMWDRLRSGSGATLAVTGAGLTLQSEDKTRYVFDAAGKLTQIIFADGYTQTLVYAGTLNTRVTDSRGRWLNFIYAPAGSAWAGLLVVAQGSDGQLIRYGYDDRSRAGLDPKFRSKTTGSGQWALRLVSYPPSTPASSYAPTTTYEYLDNRHRPYLITTVTNRPSAQPSTWETTRWTYDVKKRVTSVERQGGVNRWQYVYDDLKNQVTVTYAIDSETDMKLVLSTALAGVQARDFSPIVKEGLQTSMPWSAQSDPGSNCFLGFICPPSPPMCMPRPRTCTASCNVQQIDPTVFCPDRVLGGPVSASSEYAACREAKRLANTVLPRGCYKRHCQCSCN